MSVKFTSKALSILWSIFKYLINAVIQVEPAWFWIWPSIIWSPDHFKGRHPKWHFYILVKCHMTSTMHLEVRIHFIVLTNLHHRHILHADIKFSVMLKISTVFYIIVNMRCVIQYQSHSSITRNSTLENPNHAYNCVIEMTIYHFRNKVWSDNNVTFTIVSQIVKVLIIFWQHFI